MTLVMTSAPAATATQSTTARWSAPRDGTWPWSASPRHTSRSFRSSCSGWGTSTSSSEQQARLALAAFIRVRRGVAPGAAVQQVPLTLAQPPALSDLVEVLEGFAAADPEGGARGMALVAAAYRAAGLEADVPSRNDPRRIDVPVKRDGTLILGAEVKQLRTGEATADTLVHDATAHGVRRALLAVLRPGSLTAL